MTTARDVCSVVKPRIRELAKKNERLVGLLAIEILLALYDQGEQGKWCVLVSVLSLTIHGLEQLNIRNANVRANLARALCRLNSDPRDSAGEQGHGADPGHQILCQLFGLGE